MVNTKWGYFNSSDYWGLSFLCVKNILFVQVDELMEIFRRCKIPNSKWWGSIFRVEFTLLSPRQERSPLKFPKPASHLAAVQWHLAGVQNPLWYREASSCSNSTKKNIIKSFSIHVDMHYQILLMKTLLILTLVFLSLFSISGTISEFANRRLQNDKVLQSSTYVFLHSILFKKKLG